MSFSAASLRAVLEAHVPAAATGLAVALSGGGDSAALLAAAASPEAAFRDLPVRALHVDHGLQAASASFRRSCAALCARLRIPLTVIPVNVRTAPGASIEALARDARYAALAAALKEGECLLTAHHREDQAETLLLQAMRGAGIKGISAMPWVRALGRGWHARPLLDVPQVELKIFGARSAAGGSRDPMNDDLQFDRNYLRAQVWPLIETRWPGSAAALSRTARHAAEAQELVDGVAQSEVSRLRDGDALSVPGLRILGSRERHNAVRFWLSEAGVEPPSAARLAEALRQMLDAKIDHLPVIVWGDHALRRYRRRLFLTAAHPRRLDETLSWPSTTGARIALGANLGALRWVAQNGGLDQRRLPPCVMVRRRAGGETLRPAPTAKTQSVQHLCQAQGVLPWLRDALPLVFAGQELIAIGDLWLDAGRRVPQGNAGLGIVWEDAPILV